MQTNEQLLSRMNEDIVLRGLANGTKVSYLMNTRLFLEWIGRPAESMDEEDIRVYLRYLITEKKLEASTINICNAALRFFFAVTLKRNLNYRLIPRMKQTRRFPEILTQAELASVFEQASSLRNKAMLMTVYGAGLRVSEVCSLQVCDIDSKAMRIFVRDSKNGKDRYTLLSKEDVEILREYWSAYRPGHPDGWLFLNRNGSGKMNLFTARDACRTAVKRAGIQKDVSIHTLRHCFATHLLEAGTDIFRIKELLGHASIQSTIWYLHLLNFDTKLISPLDTLAEKHWPKPKGGE